MDDSALVGIGEARGHLQRELDGSLPGELSPLLQQLVERAPFDQFHRVKVLVPLADAPEATDDVRMAQRIEDLQFALEAREDRGVGNVWRKELDGDMPVVDDV